MWLHDGANADELTVDDISISDCNWPLWNTTKPLDLQYAAVVKIMSSIVCCILMYVVYSFCMPWQKSE